MFKVKDNFIICDDFKVALPAEVSDKVVSKIYGTATAGLISGSGILVKNRGQSVEYLGPDGEIGAGHLVGDLPEAGTLVYTREQLQTKSPFLSFTLVSAERINNQLNWINVEFEDGTRLTLCPFTLQYEVT